MALIGVSAVKFVDKNESAKFVNQYEYNYVQKYSGWVELPICTGAKGEVQLHLGLENALQATCKVEDPTKAPDMKEQAATRKAIADAANAKAAEEIDAQAAMDSQKVAAKQPVVVDPNTLPADAAVVKANSKADKE